MFFANLSHRPKQGKRKRDDSPPRNSNGPTPTNHASVEEEADEHFTQQPKSHEDPHGAKRRRPNDPGDELPVDESQAVANVELLNDLQLRNGRLIGNRRRRKAPVSPFISRKPKGITKAVALYKPPPRRAPVFGQASLMSPEEIKLSIAVRAKGAQVTLTNDLSGLPKVALDPAVDPLERTLERSEEEEDLDAEIPVYYDQAPVNNDNANIPAVDDAYTSGYFDKQGQMYYGEQAPVRSDEEASVHSDEQDDEQDPDMQVSCDSCAKFYIPATQGKGIQGSIRYVEDYREAVQEDAEFFRNNGGFTCRDCDKETLVAKKPWAAGNLKAEKTRRAKLFRTKNGLDKEKTLHECDNCKQEITSSRHACQYCENFDLCRDCFADPAISSKHQHAAGDMKLK